MAQIIKRFAFFHFLQKVFALNNWTGSKTKTEINRNKKFLTYTQHTITSNFIFNTNEWMFFFKKHLNLARLRMVLHIKLRYLLLFSLYFFPLKRLSSIDLVFITSDMWLDKKMINERSNVYSLMLMIHEHVCKTIFFLLHFYEKKNELIINLLILTWC